MTNDQAPMANDTLPMGHWCWVIGHSGFTAGYFFPASSASTITRPM